MTLPCVVKVESSKTCGLCIVIVLDILDLHNLDYSDKKLLKHFVVVHFVFFIYQRLSISFDALCYMSLVCVCVVGVRW